MGCRHYVLTAINKTGECARFPREGEGKRDVDNIKKAGVRIGKGKKGRGLVDKKGEERGGKGLIQSYVKDIR